MVSISQVLATLYATGVLLVSASLVGPISFYQLSVLTRILKEYVESLDFYGHESNSDMVTDPCLHTQEQLIEHDINLNIAQAAFPSYGKVLYSGCKEC